MIEINETQKRLTLLSLATLLSLPAGLLGAAASVPEPEAMAILRGMTDHLSALPRFGVRGHGSLEVVLRTGQKIQYDSDMTLTVERPNKLLAVREGGIADQRFFYDGVNLTLFLENENLYATTKAPATLEEALSFARDTLDIVAPAADLIYANAFDLLTQDMTAGFVVSRDTSLDGKSCSQLAFRKPGVDLQIWITNGPQPLPAKYVLTTTDVVANPQFVLTLSDWTARPQIDSGTFTFVPPAAAKRIDFVRADAQPAGSN
jgi:hypothetical protein